MRLDVLALMFNPDGLTRIAVDVAQKYPFLHDVTVKEYSRAYDGTLIYLVSAIVYGEYGANRAFVRVEISPNMITKAHNATHIIFSTLQKAIHELAQVAQKQMHVVSFSPDDLNTVAKGPPAPLELADSVALDLVGVRAITLEE